MGRNLYIGLGLLFILIMNEGCNKDDSKSDCFPNVATTRQIVNQYATIKMIGGTPAYIVEDGTIDTRLIPCNLPHDFEQDGLHVLVSGEVKGSASTGVCCDENFKITAITR